MSPERPTRRFADIAAVLVANHPDPTGFDEIRRAHPGMDSPALRRLLDRWALYGWLSVLPPSMTTTREGHLLPLVSPATVPDTIRVGAPTGPRAATRLRTTLTRYRLTTAGWEAMRATLATVPPTLRAPRSRRAPFAPCDGARELLAQAAQADARAAELHELALELRGAAFEALPDGAVVNYLRPGSTTFTARLWPDGTWRRDEPGRTTDFVPTEWLRAEWLRGGLELL